MRPQESGWSENAQPSATGEILRIPGDNGFDVVVFSLPKKDGVAERHLSCDIGRHFRDESAPPSLTLVTGQSVKIYDRDRIDGAKAEEPG